ncbi:hypothetical protein [Micromonospora sp. NPDC049274]|uniref:hypothetical protein n=1 Tax=Micromonospora sp. NPDC049274 TaxID=3154829 RepID=UPI0034166A9E
MLAVEAVERGGGRRVGGGLTKPPGRHDRLEIAETGVSERRGHPDFGDLESIKQLYF